jgi:predicted GNAT family acetyltransferase
LVIWDSGGIVSLAGVHDPAYGVGRVGPVYTPPAHRGRGYGAAASAVAARRLLDGGAGQVMLFTDLANPTSNRLYRRIGFERVGTATSWIFEPPPPAVTALGS